MKPTFESLTYSETPVLIDFSAEWCAPCKMMKPILKELKKMEGDQLKIFKIDVDKNPKLAQQYQIRGVPTLILFQKGKLLWRQSGVLSAHQLSEIISKNALAS